MSKKFKHLNLSPHWQQYFSKYPQGYTIIENLIDWVSQVDDMVDSYNELTDHVDNFKEAVNNTTDGFREELDTFLGQFDDNLALTVITTLEEWENSGFLDVVISEALQWQLDNYITTNEQDKNDLTTQLAQNMINIANYVVGDGVTDDTSAVETAINLAIQENKGLYLPRQTNVYVTNTLDMTDVLNLDLQGKITGDSSLEKTLIVGTSDNTYGLPAKIYIQSIGGVIEVKRLRNASLEIKLASEIKINVGENESFAWNNVNIGITTHLHLAGVDGGWINENTFNIGGVRRFTVTGDYSHNNNIFNKTGFENSEINMEIGHSNYFYNSRFEGSNKITMGKETGKNEFRQTYSTVSNTSSLNFTRENFNAEIVDKGYLNKFINDSIFKHSSQILNLDHNTPIVDTNLTSRQTSEIFPGLRKLRTKTGGPNVIWTSNIYEIDKDVIIKFKTDEQIFRYRIYVYDENMHPITTEPTDDYTSYGLNVFNSEGFYTANFNWGGLSILLKNTDGRLKYFKVEILQNSNNTPFSHLSAYILHDEHAFINYEEKKMKYSVANQTITGGYGKLGQTVPLNAGGLMQCVFSHETQTSASLSTASTTILVKNTDGVSVGNVVGILLNNGLTHWSNVSSVSPLTIETPLPESVGVNARVVFNEWQRLS